MPDSSRSSKPSKNFAIRSEFHHILPASVDYLPEKAVSYLDEAAKHPPACEINATEALNLARVGYIDIYLVLRDRKLTGALCLMANKGVLDIILLGGEQMVAWKDDLRAFIIDIMRKTGCKTLSVTGRKGFMRLFPELRPTGIVYGFTIDE